MMPYTPSVRYRLLLFDLDGTLADTQADLADAVNATRAWAGLPPLGLDPIRSAIGDGALALIQRTVPGVEPEAAVRHFIVHYGTHHAVKTRLYPGALETLEATTTLLRAVVTNKPERISRRILSTLGVAPHFIDLIGGDTLPVRKPDPGGLLEVMRRRRTPPEHTLMIGDSPVDVAAARAAGVASVAVAGGYADPAALEAAGPDFRLDSLAGLPALLARAKP